MPFHDDRFMDTAATSLIDGNYIKLALEDILSGDPRPSAIENTLSKYCSFQLTWANHGGIYGLFDLIPHIRSWRSQMAQVRVDITHLVTQGNTTANRHITYFTRRDGTACEIECFQFITAGEDGMWLSIFENSTVVRNVLYHRPSTKSERKSRPPMVKRASWPDERHTSEIHQPILSMHPPILPISNASLLGIPTELRDQVFREVFLQRIPIRIAVSAPRAVTRTAPRMTGMRDHDLYWDADQATWRLQHHEAPIASEKQKAYLVPESDTDLGIRLTGIAAIGHVSRSLRAEVSSFLRLAAIDVVAEVAKFDFSHVQAFLAQLPAARLQDFVVQDDGTSNCTITIDLCRPPDGALGKSSANLQNWLTFLTSINPSGHGDFADPKCELATHYRMSVSPFRERIVDPSTTQGLLQMLYNKHEQSKPGTDKLDLYKILHAWWARWRVESHLLDGSSWTRHASPDDLRLPSLSRSFVR